MRLKMLKELFSAGVLRGATVIPSGNDQSAWKLMVHKLSGESVAVTVADSSFKPDVAPPLNSSVRPHT